MRAQVNEEPTRASCRGHTNLIGAVYLNPTTTPAPSAAASSNPAAIANAAGSSNTDVEVEFWRSVRESNKPEELNAYLTNYPNGQFKSLALARIASLENGPSTTTRNLSTGVDPATFTDDPNQVTEDQIGLERGQRRDRVQRRLTGLGLDTKVKGKFDEGTRAVIMRWQARGYPKTGYLNKLQHKALLSEIVATNDTSSSGDDDDKSSRRRRGGGGGGGGHYRGPSGPGGLIGGMMGGAVPPTGMLITIQQARLRPGFFISWRQSWSDYFPAACARRRSCDPASLGHLPGNARARPDRCAAKPSA